MDCEIVGIELNLYRLIGTIPEEFYTLQSLTKLNLGFNRLKGSISSSISLMTNLSYVQLNWNRISNSIPSSVGELSELKYFEISNNRVDGTIPSTFGSLSQLTFLYMFNNRLSGTIPSSLGSLSELRYFQIDNNFVTGTLPSALGLCSLLIFLDTHSNLLSGTIPASFGSFDQLVYLFIYNNQISGPIPSTFQSMLQLQYLYLYNNFISGTLSSSFGSFTQLLEFDLGNNLLSGTLPPSLGCLFQLHDFFIYYNQISGPIPSTLGSLSRIEFFHIYENCITGSLPETLGSLLSLQYLDFNNNLITGRIPSSYNNLEHLRYFLGYSNQIGGHFPLQLNSFPNLQQLFLQQNRLSGTLDPFFENYSIVNSTSNLINLDLSGNQLSGTIPSDLFVIPSLDTIALSVNCFEGELPLTLCKANISVMSLDGLRASRFCRKQSLIPFTSVSLGRMIEGSLPDCIWELSQLGALHLAGNGLLGSIPFKLQTESIMPKLVDLTLSYNYLSGEIPKWLLEKKMNSLDLSHNKFTGDLSAMYSGSVEKMSATKGELNLAVNRLSGRLPDLETYSTLNILSGNLFSCENLPKNDENSGYYNCGSSEYNRSMMMVGVVVVFLFIVVVFDLFIRSSDRLDFRLTSLSSFRIRWRSYDIFKYFFFYDDTFLPSEVSINNYVVLLLNNVGRTLIMVGKLFVSTSVTILVCLIPLYALKADRSFITHYHQYQWYFTISYLSGTIPAIFVLVVCFVSLLSFQFTLYYFSNEFSRSIETNGKDSSFEIEKKDLALIYSLSSLESSQVRFSRNVRSSSATSRLHSQNLHTNSLKTPSAHQVNLRLIYILSLNFLVIGAVNGLYVWSTVQKLSSLSHLLIQLSISLFVMLWKTFLRSLFPDPMKYSFSVVWLLSLISVINGVMIPCVVVALTSPSCYQVSVFTVLADC
jgi:Leucine-rich repeat (LRR) protein